MNSPYQVGQEFIDEYLKRGFGTMNKTEVEVLIYWLLKKYGVLSSGLNDSSIFLKIPKSRVKSLDYQASLRYGPITEDELRQKITACIQKANFTNDNNGVKFAVEDELLRNVITAELYKLNCFNDTSFNRDVISIDFKFFALFVDQYLYPDSTSKKEKDEISQKVEQIRKKHGNNVPNVAPQHSKFVETLAYLLKNIAEGSVRGITSGSIFSTFGNIADLFNCVKNLF